MSEQTGPVRPASRHLVLKRTGVAGLTAFITINLWTGCPLLAVWIGSHVAGRTTLSMGAVGIVMALLVVLVFGSAIALARLNDLYERLAGRTHRERRAAWLRSMSAEQEKDASRRFGTTPLERIVTINVYLAVIGFLLWFFVIAGSPLPR